jgi:hypothetical protein
VIAAASFQVDPEPANAFGVDADRQRGLPERGLERAIAGGRRRAG